MDQVVGRGGLAQVRARGRVERVAPSLEAALNLLHEMAAVTWDRDMAGVELYLDDGDRPLVGIWRSLHGVGCVVLDAAGATPAFFAVTSHGPCFTTTRHGGSIRKGCSSE